MARPSELTDKIKKTAKRYVNGGYKENKELIPTIAGLACYLGKSRATLSEYRANDEEFGDIVEMLQARQEMTLVNNGLAGDYNATICRLLLSKHGYNDKMEIEQNNAFTPQVIELVAITPDGDEYSNETR